MISVKDKSVEEVVDVIFTALVKQGRRCVNKIGECVYVSPEGDHCAVGFLIPETKEFEPMMNFRAGIHGLILGVYPSLGVKHKNLEFIKDNQSLMSCVQNIHDASNLFEVEDGVAQLKKRFGIELDSINQWVETYH